MFSLIALAAVALGGDGGENRLKAVRDAYEENRSALATWGKITFRFGVGGPLTATSHDDVARIARSAWNRQSVSNGRYVFDGPSRLVEHLYPVEEMRLRRVKTSKYSWSSRLFSYQRLCNGDTTFIDTVEPDIDDAAPATHSTSIRAGTRPFFEAFVFPLFLGDPDPPLDDFGRCLSAALDRVPGGYAIASVTKENLDGIDTLRIAINGEDQYRRRHAYWIDVEHGAVPLRHQVVEYVPHRKVDVLVERYFADVRWTTRGWLPFRQIVVQGELSPSGEVTGLILDELVIEEADLEHRPAQSAFQIELPAQHGEKGYNVVDGDRNRVYEPRSVWRLADLSSAASARARRMRITAGDVPAPILPGPRQAGSLWPSALIVLGALMLLAAGTTIYRRSRHAW